MTDFNRDERTPLESYTFTYTEQELKNMRNEIDKRPVVKMIVVSVIWTVLFIIYLIFLGTNRFEVGLMFAALIFIAAAWVMRFKRRKYVAQHSDKRVAQGEYLYEFFDDCLRLTVHRNGRFVGCSYIELSEIERYWNTKDFYVFTANTLLYMVKKSELSENSRVPELVCRSNLQKAPEVPETQNGEKKIPEELKTLDKLAFSFFVASFTMPLALIIIMAIITEFLNPNAAVLGAGFFLCFLAAVASLISGIILRKNGVNRKRNIISGIILAIVYFVLASFWIFLGIISGV